MPYRQIGNNDNKFINNFPYLKRRRWSVISIIVVSIIINIIWYKYKSRNLLLAVCRLCCLYCFGVLKCLHFNCYGKAWSCLSWTNINVTQARDMAVTKPFLHVRWPLIATPTTIAFSPRFEHNKVVHISTLTLTCLKESIINNNHLMFSQSESWQLRVLHLIIVGHTRT